MNSSITSSPDNHIFDVDTADFNVDKLDRLKNNSREVITAPFQAFHKQKKWFQGFSLRFYAEMIGDLAF